MCKNNNQFEDMQKFLQKRKEKQKLNNKNKIVSMYENGHKQK